MQMARPTRALPVIRKGSFYNRAVMNYIVHQKGKNVTQPTVLEGTWEELSAHAHGFFGKRLRLVTIEDGHKTLPVDTEVARIAAIRGGMGKFADTSRTTLASEELCDERRRDEANFEVKSGTDLR